MNTSDADPGGFRDYADENFDEFFLAAFGHSLYRSTGNAAWTLRCSDVSLAPNMLHQFERGRHAGELALAICTCEEPTNVAGGFIGGRSQLVVYSIESDICTQASLSPRCIASFQNRLFYGEGEKMGWSEIGDLVSYSDASSILIQPGVGGSEITGILPTRDIDQKLIIWKKEAIFLFTPRWGSTDQQIPVAGDELDLQTSSVRPLSLGTGCVATRSIQFVPGERNADVFFLSPDGVRALSRAENDVQTGAGFPLSYKIPTWIDRINFTHANKATATVFDNSYYIAVPLDGAIDNTHVLRYDIANKAWSLHTWQGKDILVSKLNASERMWMQSNILTNDCSVTAVAGDPTFQVYRLFEDNFDPSTDASNFNLVPISREETRAFTLKDPLTKKVWDKVSFQFSSGETARIAVAYRRDQGAYATITEFLFPGSGETIVLGEDPLPWNNADEITRKRTFDLSDIGPSYSLQLRIGGVSGASETGRVSTYFTEVKGHLLTDEFVEDE
ncbi:MAG: hypothetical protein V3S83_12600 [Gemmatimonadota bacterium]